MAETAPRRMSVEEFFRWQQDQEELYELVDGLPVKRHRMMTGASHQHDRVVVNIIVDLGLQLRDGPCRPTTADIAFRTRIDAVRRPDVTVECAELVRNAYESLQPRLVVEVLSPSTTSIDQIRKLDEYKRHPTLDHILLVETAEPAATLYSRGEGGRWDSTDYAGLDARIDLPAINAALTLAEMYRGLTFD